MLQIKLKAHIPLLLLWLLTGCSAKPSVVAYDGKYSGKGTNTAYVVSHGLHSGFVVPATPIYDVLPALERRFGESPYLEFGWGDKEYYQAEEVTTGMTLKAVFWPTGSVVHAVAVPADVSAYFPEGEVRLICLNEKELASLISFISGSFYRDESGQLLKLKRGKYGDSQFYEGVGDYYMMNTCNMWTAKGMNSMGMDISPTFKFSAGGVMDYLEEMDNAEHCLH